MNSKLKVLLSVVAMSFVMVGCGSSSSSSTEPIIDNSVLADDENEYGYIGENVIFGGIEVVGNWNLYNSEDLHDSLYGRFESDGTGRFSHMQSNAQVYFVYGVSKDGQIIETSETIKIKILRVMKDALTVTEDGVTKTFDCYNIEYSDWTGTKNADMCPSRRF